MSAIKTDAHLLIDELPDNATWEDVMYGIYVRQSIESGLRDAGNGNTIDVEEVRRQFGLST